METDVQHESRVQLRPDHSVYQERVRRERKQALVEMRGGKRVVCGYNRCIAALEFHHRDPADKKFQLSKENLLKRWPVVLAEAEKCDLYCATCHRELEESLRTPLGQGDEEE